MYCSKCARGTGAREDIMTTTTTAAKAPSRVSKGMQFRSTLADGNPLWETIESPKSGQWLCRVIDEPMEINGRTFPSDFAGHEAVFTSGDILSRMEFARRWASIASADEAWWDAQIEGATVHYHDSFGQFVRGVIVVDENGKKAMRSTALVGPWRGVVRVSESGDVQHGYHAKRILEGGTFTPSASNMWECSEHLRARHEDPTVMEPVSLKAPEPSREEKAEQAIVRKLAAISQAAGDWKVSPAERLAKVAALASL